MHCDETFRAQIRANLGHFEPQRNYDGRAAAVAITIVEQAYGADLPGLPRHETWQNDAALILTRRAATLRRHPGQWALPGGRVDADESPLETALREMQEEIGLVLGNDAVLGQLDDFVTRSGFTITPIVFWAGAANDLAPNLDEVDSIHRIPVAEFMRADAPLLEQTEHGDAPVLRMPVGNSWIAAPTAAMLYQFREVCVHGRHTRVAHFEQPQFAWR